MVEVHDFRWSTPTSAIVCGASGSGKTELFSKILLHKHLLFKPEPAAVILYYKEWQPAYTHMNQNKLVNHFYQGVPDKESLRDIALQYKEKGGCICVFDDLSSEINSGSKVDFVELFTVLSHHLLITPIIVLH
ncbi:MAG TPA: hypothetical protein EYO76_07445, partial [Flavobacteriaceae bacterium]|nr:hypothetical protein [Flavobacteriaceae bacterium]